jgi:hypothetical protein
MAIETKETTKTGLSLETLFNSIKSYPEIEKNVFKALDLFDDTFEVKNIIASIDKTSKGELKVLISLVFVNNISRYNFSYTNFNGSGGFKSKCSCEYTANSKRVSVDKLIEQINIDQTKKKK